MTSVPEPAGSRTAPAAGRGPALLLDGSVRLLDLESFVDDRGVLTPITFDEFGFNAARAFVVSAPQGAVRGGHGHRHVRQLLFRASGTIEVDLRHAGSQALITLDEHRPAALLEPGVWARQTYVGAESTLIVFADGPYDPAEYVDDVSADEGAS
jgi:dTDP-4-dehydrorhamnose 3,5-epimerase-like enzyme